MFAIPLRVDNIQHKILLPSLSEQKLSPSAVPPFPLVWSCVTYDGDGAYRGTLLPMLDELCRLTGSLGPSAPIAIRSASGGKGRSSFAPAFIAATAASFSVPMP